MGTEADFQKHFEKSLEDIHHYPRYTNGDISDKEYYLIEKDLISYLQQTQPDAYKKLEDNYGTDTSAEIIRALKDEITHKPLWVIIRHGLDVRGIHFQLFDRIPRSSESTDNPKNNTIAYLSQLEIGEEKRPDIVLFLNGLPIIVIELKHEKNQNVNDAVAQYNSRNQKDKIFQLPFLYIAADTSEVKVATNPAKEKFFRWYNAGLVNTPLNKGEYPVEYLYRNVLSIDSILEAISFFLIYVPKIEATSDSLEKPAYSIFPRYHQSRMVNKVCSNLITYHSETECCGEKYLINHSAGSGKTLSISWLADRLNSLYDPGTNKKIIDLVFILTDRRVLDKNVGDELRNFTHLKHKMKFAKKSGDLPRFIKNREQIIVTTQQKINWILDELKKDDSFRELNVALLIDEAHRSQDGRTGTNIRSLFKDENKPDNTENTIEEDEQVIDELKNVFFPNLLIVAFTATPGRSTVQLFGEPFDVYSEAEAIQEGYILDVASSIISYKTLYNLESRVILKDDGHEYPVGIISKMLKYVAYQDKGLIQYKAELMLRIFEEDVHDLIDGKAKAMIVTSSRIAGLFYFQVIKEKLKEKRSVEPDRFDYDVLFAFSDFTHPETGKEITEQQVNSLQPNDLIEDIFDTDKYRLLIVANKFQTGFDQPFLGGMFLDKPVSDINAVQTISRLNRYHEGKDRVVVVDFTNNADQIIRAFKKYRSGTPYEPSEPDFDRLTSLYEEIISWNIFNQKTAEETGEIIKSGNDPDLQSQAQKLRFLFQNKIKDIEAGKGYINLLSKFSSSCIFLSNFFEINEDMMIFSIFCEFIYSQLLKVGGETELKKIMKTIYVSKASVFYIGEKGLKGEYKGKKGRTGGEPPKINKVSVKDVIEKIKDKYKISEEEAIIIREVCDEKIQDDNIRTVIFKHKNEEPYLFDHYKKEIRKSIEDSYSYRSLYECLTDEKYIDIGSIFDIMSHTVIKVNLDECA
ncbi:MAG: DEAD/DEAH box helicase family protein [Spirochaetia bacterium]|jgi:type I restriction enzyme R subunit|nr:DEAD/DEAH box helicase family protein [Spirochaetia bacterium]